jgi:NAD(P)-dependent dehydrogenase (short-subunit alcohol dehydrogenase family)
MSEAPTNGSNGVHPLNPPRVALITGAAQGIGRAIALRLSQDGLDVALNDIPSNLANLEAVRKEIMRNLGSNGSKRRCVLLTGDVSKEEGVIAMVENTVTELGGLDIVSTCSLRLALRRLRYSQMIANAGIAIVSELVESKRSDCLQPSLSTHAF